MLSFLAVWLILLLLPASLRERFEANNAEARRYRTPSRYAVAAVLSVVALVATVTFLPAFGNSIYAVFYIAVVLSAWNGGLGPGLLATGIGAAAAVSH